jgi:formylmethanofuran dehydrogenase subunit E
MDDTTLARRTLLAGLAPLALLAHDENSEPALDRTAMIHGMSGPFVVAGYRMGEAALRVLSLRRGSMDLEVIHYSPREVQWSCIIDGLQAATGASVGKMNLQMQPAAKAQTRSVLRNRKTGKSITMTLTAGFVQGFLNTPMDKLAIAGAKVVALPEAEIFSVR